MPTYQYRCSSCDHAFDQLKSISERDAPCSEPCPSCTKNEVRRDWISAPAAAVDMNLTPGQDFKEVMQKVSRGVPQRYRSNLDRAASRRGTVWGNG
jgi:putative FmdB family regulatory protein